MTDHTRDEVGKLGNWLIESDDEITAIAARQTSNPQACQHRTAALPFIISEDGLGIQPATLSSR